MVLAYLGYTLLGGIVPSLAQELPDPIVHYSFDIESVLGTRLTDQSGNSVDGSIIPADNGPVAGEPGIYVGAFRFHGSDSPSGLVLVPASTIPAGSESRTISLWFKQAAEAGRDMLFGYGADEPGRSINLGLEADGIRLRHWGGNITYGRGLDFTGKDAGWHHVALRVNENARTFADVDLFLDGVLLTPQSGGAISVLLNTADGPCGVGDSATPNTAAGFDGWIDEFKVWGSPLSEQQILKLAEAPPMPEITSFYSSPQNRVPSGSDVTLEWSVEDAKKLTLNPGGIDVTNSRSIVVNPETKTTYTLVASDGDNPDASSSLTLSVGPEPFPNVIVFFLDDFGWADWEQNGEPTGSIFYQTPHMNRLADGGLYFPNGYASGPVCSPTRAALLTGQSPAYNKLTDWISGSGDRGRPILEAEWVKQLDTSTPNFASVLGNAGYRTLHIGKWHLGEGASLSSSPINHGFDFNVGGNLYGTPPGPERYFASANGFSGLPGLGPDIAPEGSYLTDVLTEQAVEQIQLAASENTAFIMYLSHFAVHTPIQAPAATVAKYQAILDRNPNMDWQGHANPTYAAMIEHVDLSLGAILAALENPDGDPSTDDSIVDNTMVVFTSDNGGLLGYTSNRPLRGGKGFVHEGGIREPWVFSWPGRIHQGVNEEPIASHDLFPTILTLVGIAPPDGHVVNGQDLTPLLIGQAFERETPLIFHYPHWSPQGGKPYSALREGDWKLLYNYSAGSWELYNLTTDPGETTNLINAEAERAAVFSHALTEGLATLEANYPRNSDTQVEQPPIPLATPRQ